MRVPVAWRCAGRSYAVGATVTTALHIIRPGTLVSHPPYGDIRCGLRAPAGTAMVQHGNTGGPEAVAGGEPPRRRDRFLPLMVERQARGRIEDRARNVLAKHRHAVADVGLSASHGQGAADAKRWSDRNDRNIERIRSTQ